MVMIETSQESLKVQLFKVRISLLADGDLPWFLGSTFRGLLGHSFKSISCAVKNKTCKSCLLKEKCAYSYVFETPVPDNSERMKLYPYAPHPFILEAPFLENGQVKKDQQLTFQLALIGKGIEFFPYFVCSIEEMGERGLGAQRIPFALVEIEDLEGGILYRKGNDILGPLPKAIELPLAPNENQSEKLSLKFLTPLRLMHQGRQSRTFHFSAFIGTLLRRVSSLAFFHHGFEPKIPYRELVERSESVGVFTIENRFMPLSRYSNRQNKKIDIGGIMGSFQLEGNLSPYMPLLMAGEILHAGKGTAFGLGKYKLIYET